MTLISFFDAGKRSAYIANERLITDYIDIHSNIFPLLLFHIRYELISLCQYDLLFLFLFFSCTWERKPLTGEWQIEATAAAAAKRKKNTLKIAILHLKVQLRDVFWSLKFSHHHFCSMRAPDVRRNVIFVCSWFNSPQKYNHHTCAYRDKCLKTRKNELFF